MELVPNPLSLSAQEGRNAAQTLGENVAGSKHKKGEFKVHEQRWAAEAKAAENLMNVTSPLKEIELTTPVSESQAKRAASEAS